MSVLRLRHAIERASRRRWLGILIVLLLAFLLILLVFHTLEHGLEDGTLLTCFAIVVFLTVKLGISGVGEGVRRVVPMLRAPPFGPMAAVAARRKPPPGASPLRL